MDAFFLIFHFLIWFCLERLTAEIKSLLKIAFTSVVKVGFDKIDMIRNWAIRYFMEVLRFTPILAITGNMAWVVSTSRRWANVLRLWNRLVSMEENRLT